MKVAVAGGCYEINKKEGQGLTEKSLTNFNRSSNYIIRYIHSLPKKDSTSGSSVRPAVSSRLAVYDFRSVAEVVTMPVM